MPYATTKDNVKLYYEEAGSGTPILFGHEFAGDHRNWETQMRFFSRRHRCITYSARGYKPSDVPPDCEGLQLQALGRATRSRCSTISRSTRRISSACRWAATPRSMLGIHHPDRSLSLTAAGAGSGSERGAHRGVPQDLRRRPRDEFEKHGSEHVVKHYGMSPARIPFLVKDPRGFEEFNEMFAEHDAEGLRPTPLRGFQAERPSLYDFEADIRKINVPTLIVVGDEDEPCLEPSFFLKQWIPTVRPGGVPQDRPRGEPGGAGAVQRGGRRLHRPRRSRPLAGARSAVDRK